MLTRVTITGADDSTDIDQLIELSAKYPFVEWGILVSESQEGMSRFPSRQWIERFSLWSILKRMNVSTHLCGRWVRDLLKGNLDFDILPPGILYASNRLQINTHSKPHSIDIKALVNNLDKLPPMNVIFQWDGINNILPYAVKGCRLYTYRSIDVSVLFDTSGGAGILPEEWPNDLLDISCGYAGGLGPYSIEEQIKKINQVCHSPFWVDMERRVRTDDDSALDMEKVKKVLEITAPLIGK